MHGCGATKLTQKNGGCIFDHEASNFFLGARGRCMRRVIAGWLRDS